MPSDLRQQAYKKIRNRIDNGDLAVGSRLSDLALSREVGLSRTPIREAMVQLECEGFIEPGSEGGYVVRRPAIGELIHLLEVREAIEPFCAERAAKRLTPEQLDYLQEQLDQVREVARVVRFAKLTKVDGELGQRYELADAAFHQLILKVGGNDYMLRMLRELRMLSRVFGFRRYTPANPALRAVSIVLLHHGRVLSALRRGDGAAAAEHMRSHIRHAVHITKAYAEWLEAEYGGEQPKSEDWPQHLRQQIEQIDRD